MHFHFPRYHPFHAIFRILTSSPNSARTPLEILYFRKIITFFIAFSAICRLFSRDPFLLTRAQKKFARRRPRVIDAAVSKSRSGRNKLPVRAARFVRWKIAVRPPYEVSALAGTLNAGKKIRNCVRQKKRIIYFIPLRCGDARDLCAETAIRL